MAKIGRPRASEIIDGKKLCPNCEQIKPLSYFHNCKCGVGGKATYCKPCVVKRAVGYAQRLRRKRLSKERRAQIADYMRWVRSLRQYAKTPERLADMKRNERAILLASSSKYGPLKHSLQRACEQRPAEHEFERDERLREERHDAREANTQRALASLDAVKARGPW